MTSLTQWTWLWVNSGSWWWTGRPGVLRFMGSQRVGDDWATELNWVTQVILCLGLCGHPVYKNQQLIIIQPKRHFFYVYAHPELRQNIFLRSCNICKKENFIATIEQIILTNEIQYSVLQIKIHSFYTL